MPALFPQNMQLIKKSRRMLSGIFHARPPTALSPTNPRSKARLSRRRRSKRSTPSSSSSSSSLTRRTMDVFICRGEKRKRESLDGGDDDWEFVQCKKRLVRGGVGALVVAETEIRREQVGRQDKSCSLPLPYEASGAEPGELPDGYEELLQDVHSNLENLTISEVDDLLPNDTTSTEQKTPEPHTDLDPTWLEGIHDCETRYRARRCHSESSTRILSYANAVTGELPDGSGRRSAPPNLETAWSLSSALGRRASFGSVTALSEDGMLDGMLDDSALELVLFAETETEIDVEAGAEGDTAIHERDEIPEEIEVEDAGEEAAVEDVTVEAAMAAVAEAILQPTWQGVEATTPPSDETALGGWQVTDESKGQREPGSEPSSEPVWEHVQEPALEQASKPHWKPASPPAEPIPELTFKMKYDSLVNRGLDATEVDLEPRVCRRQATAGDVASRIRAVKERMLESLLDIEHRLRPHCYEASS